jgi:putative ABC transport system substrate-binding protein
MREWIAAFWQGLFETGYVEGRNVTAEYRWAEGDNGRLPTLAADLVRRPVAVIAALGSTPAALAVKAATQTIPTVFTVGTDPVQVGLVASLAQPGGNLTGITVMTVELLAKGLSVMRELLPTASTIAVLINPDNVAQSEIETRDTHAAALALGLRVVILHASRPADIERAFATVSRERADALVVSGENFFITEGSLIVALAARYAMPTMYPYARFAAMGGLVSYGAEDQTDTFRTAGTYVGRILKGKKPADLPVQQSSRIGLAINLKTAKTLGINVPTPILLRADDIIE